MRVLVAPDKFKGTLTARQAAHAIGRGWRRVRSNDALDLLPMSDGGDGFGAVMSDLIGGRVRRVATTDAAGRSCRARWWWEPHGRTAIVDSAEIIGLALLPANRFHPFELDTWGLGRALTVAAAQEPRRSLIGIGGSATNDAGFGLARSLGWRFLTKRGAEIDAWRELAGCRTIEAPPTRPELGRLMVAVDVGNPLLGPKGCTRVYGAQKGLGTGDFETAEAALQRLSELLDHPRSSALATVPGAGAAGGLGFGLMAFLGAEPVPGFSLFSREADLPNRVRNADLVITGEGRLDDQSLMGKGVGRLADLCSRERVPCIAIAGEIQLWEAGTGPFDLAYSVSLLNGAQRALERPSSSLAKAAAQAASEASPN